MILTFADANINKNNHYNVENNFINEFNLTLHSQSDFISPSKIQ